MKVNQDGMNKQKTFPDLWKSGNSQQTDLGNFTVLKVSKKTDFCLFSHHLEVQRSRTSKVLSELLNVFVKLPICHGGISRRSALWHFLICVSLAGAIWSSERPFRHTKCLPNAFQRLAREKRKPAISCDWESESTKGSMMTSCGCLVSHSCGWQLVHEACSLHFMSSSIQSSESQRRLQSPTVVSATSIKFIRGSQSRADMVPPSSGTHTPSCLLLCCAWLPLSSSLYDPSLLLMLQHFGRKEDGRRRMCPSPCLPFRRLPGSFLEFSPMATPNDKVVGDYNPAKIRGSVTIAKVKWI